MKKFILSASVILVFVFYLIYNRPVTPVSLPNNNVIGLNFPKEQLPIVNRPTSQAATPPVVKPTNQPAVVKAPVVKTAGQYRDGQYTGNSIDVYYGNVQVKAVVTGGKLSDIQMLDYPRDRSTSLRIAQQSLPQLISEAITAQSAQVDAVSGATETSSGFQQSLASALAQAKN